MKVIFLDIDGVLNHAGTEDHAPGGCIGVDSKCVKALRLIVEATGAKIVLTSTWKEEWSPYYERCSPDVIYLMQELAKEGLTIFSKTEDDIVHRGKGISDWLACFGPDVGGNVTDWVVLDDDIYIDFAQYPGLMSRLVKTAFGGGGLKEELAERAIQILNGGGEIMNRTPEEAKQGLEHCINGTSCRGCPYCEECAIASDCNPMHKDLQEYIQQLESGLSNLAEAFATLREQNEILEVERDAAVKNVRRGCSTCKHRAKEIREAPCNSCRRNGQGGIKECWQWRGVQKEEST